MIRARRAPPKVSWAYLRRMAGYGPRPNSRRKRKAREDARLVAARMDAGYSEGWARARRRYESLPDATLARIIASGRIG